MQLQMWNPQQLLLSGGAFNITGIDMPRPSHQRPGLLGGPPGNNLWQGPFSPIYTGPPVYTGPNFNQMMGPQHLNSPRIPSLMNQGPTFINSLAHSNQRGPHGQWNGMSKTGNSYSNDEIRLARKSLAMFTRQSGQMHQMESRLMKNGGSNSWEGESDTLEHIPIPFPLPPRGHTKTGAKVWDPEKHSAETPAKRAKLDDSFSSYDSDSTTFISSDSECDTEGKTPSTAEKGQDLTGFLSSINSNEKMEPSTSSAHHLSATASKQSASDLTSASCSTVIGVDDDSEDSDVQIVKSPPKPIPEIILIEDSPQKKRVNQKPKRRERARHHTV